MAASVASLLCVGRAVLVEDGGIECATCRLFGVPDAPCFDETCGCSECEGIRAAMEDEL